jgi:hypothetical protein
MPTAAELATELREHEWIFDLFACGFDLISAWLPVPQSDAELERFRDAVTQATNRLGTAMIRADGGVPDAVWHYLDIPGDDRSRLEPAFLGRLSTLLGAIDEAARGLNYLGDFCDGKTWIAVDREMRRHHMQLNRGHRHVVLKPPLRFPQDETSWWRRALQAGMLEEAPIRGAHWSRRFTNLCRVPDIPGCELIHRALSKTDLPPVDWSHLRIGMVPLIHGLEMVDGVARLTPGPLTIVTDAQNHLIIEPDSVDWEHLQQNATSAIRHLAEREVQIVLFPEAVVSDQVLDSIKTELRRLAVNGSVYPALVLAGTFERPCAPTGRPGFNQAVVLNGRGEELWRQSKLHPYSMKPYEQALYGLESIFGGRDADEHITTHPRQIAFYDSPLTGARMVVAICEDSAQEDPYMTAIRWMRPNLVMIPVLAGALCKGRGFEKTVGGLAMDPGCLTAVVNSAALPRAEWRINARSGEPPLGIVGLPQMNHAKDHMAVALLESVVRLSETGPEVLVFQCPGLVVDGG